MAKIAYPSKRNSQKLLIVISIFAFFLASADAETRGRHLTLAPVIGLMGIEVHKTFWREQIPLAGMPRAVGVKHCHET